VVLASAPLFGAAREACLKTLELTGGRIAVLPETYLGLRHGPMSFVHRDTLVLCMISSDPRRRRYEMDLVNELRAKGIGRLVALAPADAPAEPFHDFVSTEASSLPDFLRAPVEIVFCQLLGYYFSRKFGLDPDNPSPGGVINRVVEGVTIYED
jgi:tagatose-6-phosphate ketose/aldose isomerase